MVRILIFLLAFSTSLSAQKSVISGKIIDKDNGFPLIGATVVAEQFGEHIEGTITDFDGSYLLQLDTGTYDIVISYVSYAKKVIQRFAVLKPASTLDILMEAESQTLSEIVVKAEAITGTDASLISLQKKAFAIQDGVSSQQINRSGSSNAADAMRQVTGAVIESNRYVVMRGLGDRYSIAHLNSTALPSTDPYRNSVSLDMIPSQMIDHIVTVKTFTPDLPGNFSGGLVNVNTKAIPERFNLSFGVSTSLNTRSSLISNFNYLPEDGTFDWLGFDDGSRDQPAILRTEANRALLSSSSYLSARKVENESVRSVFHEVSRQMSNRFIPVQDRSPLNYGFEFAVGNRYNLFGRELGFSLGVIYDADYGHYNQGTVATYINNSSDHLFPYQSLTESKSTFNPKLGSLLNLAYKFSANHLITGNIIFNNDSEYIGRQQTGNFLGQVSNSLADFNTNVLEFVQRQVINYQLRGRHFIPALNGLEIEWMGVRSASFQKEPDLRYFAYTSVQEKGETEYFINNAEYAFPYHFFRTLDDDQTQVKIDITLPFLTKGLKSSANQLKFGGYYSKTLRDFEEYRYQLNNSGVPSNLNFTTFDGDFDAFFDYENFGVIDTVFDEGRSVTRYTTGYHYINQINARNFYQGEQRIAAGYLMSIFNPTPRIKLVGGVRLETTDMKVVSRDETAQQGQIDQFDWLYSLNVIYSLSEKSNFRVAGSKTLARPNMREIAPFVQFDTKNGFFNVGNPALQRTLIRNYDVRYEYYSRPGELFALSGFYKEFDQPIIKAFNPRATIPELSFINVDEARIFGAEIELRKNLDFISQKFTHFFWSINFALIHSSYKIPEQEIVNSKNIDATYAETERPFQGQAPYVANMSLAYVNTQIGLESALDFNVSGQKLYNISLFATPDVYERPYPLLNYKIAKRFGNHYYLSLKVRNILDTMNRKAQIFKGQEYIAESFRLGTSFGLSLSYQIR
jgi:outer membrane receptor for ferrienterochelin and colicin